LAPANAVTYNFTATLSSLSKSGDSGAFASDTSGLSIGQSITGSFSYDLSSAPASGTSVPENFNSANYVGANILVNLPAISLAEDNVGLKVVDSLHSADSFSLGKRYGTNSLTFDYSINLQGPSSVFSSTQPPPDLVLSEFTEAMLSFQIVTIAHDSSGLPFVTGNGQAVFNITSLEQVAAVPEPSTWAMMMLGFAGVGLMTYHRRKTVAFAAWYYGDSALNGSAIATTPLGALSVTALTGSPNCPA
jgi:hypothetical protein